MQQLFQDSMAIVRYFGKSTLFITFTANPGWKGIQDELLLMQAATDRPDLIARVFHLKQKDLLAQIRHAQIFGRFLGCVWTIEYQKRGLPHMHLLLFLHPRIDSLHLSALMKSFVQSYPRLCKTQLVICEP